MQRQVVTKVYKNSKQSLRIADGRLFGFRLQKQKTWSRDFTNDLVSCKFSSEAHVIIDQDVNEIDGNFYIPIFTGMCKV